MTVYVVLEKQQESGSWDPIQTVEATTDLSAIRKALDGASEVADEYVAVPARSWRPRRVKAETKTQLTLT